LKVQATQDSYSTEWQQIEITGDLAQLLPSNSAKPGSEKIQVRNVSEKSGSGKIQSDSNSPLLLLGDSYTLVFHDFYAERAGLLDQLTNELGVAPDLIGTRGSGATTVRVSLYRRTLKDPNYLSKKRVVVWCFSAREFSEADLWSKVPVSK
jgi:alginate O-acetyltransferase complex protein AlgJ